MQRRFLLSGLAAAALAALSACADEVPTLSGDGAFPDGAVPVTLEVLVPAAEFIERLGTFSGYTDAWDAPYLVVANQYQGTLSAHALTGFFGFPRDVTYLVDGVEKRDSAFQYDESDLVLRVDTAGVSETPFTVQVWEATQDWHGNSATWELAVDSGAVTIPWQEPGGTRGALLGQATFTGGTDSLRVTLPASAVEALADTALQGVVLTVAETGRRVLFTDVFLLAAAVPDSADPDTVVITTVQGIRDRVFVYTPDVPSPGPDEWAVGGIRGARTLVRLDPDQPVPACAQPQNCGTVPLSQVSLNRVSLVLDPVPVPGGFGPLEPVPVSLRAVNEPELGRSAPLGPTVSDGRAFLAGGDTLLELGITALARSVAANDSLPETYMLLSEIPGVGIPPTFGVAFFQGQPRLRIVYTLPARRRLP